MIVSDPELENAMTPKERELLDEYAALIADVTFLGKHELAELLWIEATMERDRFARRAKRREQA